MSKPSLGPESMTQVKELKWVDRFRTAFWASGVVVLWMVSAYFLLRTLRSRAPLKGSMPSVGDLASIFFGASSIALIIFSLVIAVAAIIQWRDVRKTTEAAEAVLKGTQKRMDDIEKELRGRVDAAVGATLGNLHSNPTVDIQTEDDQAYLSEALHLSERAYERLKEIPGNARYVALNSIVYFSCLLRLQSDKDLLLGQGRELRDIGRTYRHLPYAAPYLLTFSRVALVYSSDHAEVEQALRILEDLLKTRLTSVHEREARYLAASLSKKLAELPIPAS